MATRRTARTGPPRACGRSRAARAHPGVRRSSSRATRTSTPGPKRRAGRWRDYSECADAWVRRVLRANRRPGAESLPSPLRSNVANAAKGLRVVAEATRTEVSRNCWVLRESIGLHECNGFVTNVAPTRFENWRYLSPALCLPLPGLRALPDLARLPRPYAWAPSTSGRIPFG